MCMTYTQNCMKLCALSILDCFAVYLLPKFGIICSFFLLIWPAVSWPCWSNVYIIVSTKNIMSLQNVKVKSVHLLWNQIFKHVVLGHQQYEQQVLGPSRSVFFWVPALFAFVVNNSSKLCTVEHGVPQGSVLGPLLFSLYINYFPVLINKNTDVLVFADSTNVRLIPRTSLLKSVIVP